MMPKRTIRSRNQGFTMVEIVIVVAIIAVLSAIAAPRLMDAINGASIRYSATNLGGLLQTARMQAVRKNTFYGIQSTTLTGGDLGYFVDLSAGRTGYYAAGDPVVSLGTKVTVTNGTGSGAPNESSFVTSLGFTVAASGNTPYFNARGLPCIANIATNTCPQSVGQGFVMFLQSNNTVGGIRWAAVAVNGSGHVEVFTSDTAGNWVQR